MSTQRCSDSRNTQAKTRWCMAITARSPSTNPCQPRLGAHSSTACATDSSSGRRAAANWALASCAASAAPSGSGAEGRPGTTTWVGWAPGQAVPRRVRRPGRCCPTGSPDCYPGGRHRARGDRLRPTGAARTPAQRGTAQDAHTDARPIRRRPPRGSSRPTVTAQPRGHWYRDRFRQAFRVDLETFPQVSDRSYVAYSHTCPQHPHGSTTGLSTVGLH